MAEVAGSGRLGRLLRRTRSDISEVRMKRNVVILISITMLIVQTPAPVAAQLPFGLGFATEGTQWLNHGQLLNQYIRQGQELAQALKQTADMLRNTQQLTTQVFGPVTPDLNQLAQLVQ